MLTRISAVLRGKHYEALAERWLSAQGLMTLARNFNVRGGELDLVMAEGSTVIFVEVRFRKSGRFVGALESVTAAKQARVAHAAAIWLQHNPALAERACRFDVIGIEGAGERPRISWIKNAFTA